MSTKQVSLAVACTDFLKARGKKKGTLAHVLAPKRAAYHVLTSQGGSLVCFANQEGTLARVFQQLSPPAPLLCTSLVPWHYFASAQSLHRGLNSIRGDCDTFNLPHSRLSSSLSSSDIRNYVKRKQTKLVAQTMIRRAFGGFSPFRSPDFPFMTANTSSKYKQCNICLWQACLPRAEPFSDEEDASSCYIVCPDCYRPAPPGPWW